MEKLTIQIKNALVNAGYVEDEPTIENLIECYLDFADAYGGDVEELREEINNGEITMGEMIKALMR